MRNAFESDQAPFVAIAYDGVALQIFRVLQLIKLAVSMKSSFSNLSQPTLHDFLNPALKALIQTEINHLEQQVQAQSGVRSSSTEFAAVLSALKRC